jgi:hypothetical protein
MPETYNPRERTFIKVSEVKLCPSCGQPLPSDVKPMTNHMNAYMHPVTKHVNVVNSNEETINLKGETFFICEKISGKWFMRKDCTKVGKEWVYTPKADEPPVKQSDVPDGTLESTTVVKSKLQAAQQNNSNL